jgi:predicted NodU family carbamoyl transferase
MVCIGGESQMTLDLNDVMAVLIHLLSHNLAHAENAFECPFDEGIMVSMVRGGGSRKRWSWIKSRIPYSIGMERRRTWCITGTRMNV